MTIKKAIIPAAGWGTRFLPITKSQPKEMLPIFNRPAIQYSVEDAIACGVELIVIVTASGKSAIENYFDDSFELESILEKKGETRLVEDMRRLTSKVDICYIRQKQQLGLGHAVLTAKNVIGDEAFMLMLPDDIFQMGEAVTKQMAKVFQDFGGPVVAIEKVAPENVSRYGIVQPRELRERVYEVLDLIEKPGHKEAPSDLAIMGRYILGPEVFPVLKETPPGKNGELQLTDALRRMLRGQRIFGYRFEGQRYDAGTPLGLLQTSIATALADPDIGPQLKDYLRKSLPAN